MHPDDVARRRGGRSRLARLGEDDGAFDDEFMRAVPIDKRLELVWDLTLDYYAWSLRDGREPRLQRLVCRLERTAR